MMDFTQRLSSKNLPLQQWILLPIGCLLAGGCITGCGGQSEEPATTASVVNQTVVENTVEVPVAASSAPKVIVKSPDRTSKTTISSGSTTTTKSATGSVAKPQIAAVPARPATRGAAAAPAAAPGAAAPAPKASNAPLVVQAQVVATSKAMKAGEYDGKSYLTYTKYKVLSVEKGSYQKPQIVAVHWGVNNGKTGAAAAYKIGQKMRLELEMFDKYLEKNPVVGTLAAADEVSDMDSEPYWAG